jgi:hypothetical protein
MPRAAQTSLIVAAVALITLIGSYEADRPMAQDDPQRVLVGVWEGTVRQGRNSAPTRLEFSQRGDKLVWKWNWDAPFGKGEAEGTVAKYSPSSVELSGRYTSHPSLRVQGSPITMSLTVSGNELQGTGLTAAVNAVFSLSLTRK